MSKKPGDPIQSAHVFGGDLAGDESMMRRLDAQARGVVPELRPGTILTTSGGGVPLAEVKRVDGKEQYVAVDGTLWQKATNPLRGTFVAWNEKE